jgi:AhpD family alkylhydroperoxidase
MQPRIAYVQAASEGFKAMLGVEAYVSHCSIEPMLGHLIKFRVSQMNGCAYCLDMHSKDLRALGETEPRLYGLNAWRESPFYTDRERAALDWAEAVTRVADSHVEDEVYQRARAIFNERELVDLTWIVAAINAWNRMAISFRAAPGEYQSKLKPKT